MKIRFIQFAALSVTVVFSSMAFAGGAACDSQKGAHKGMSVEALKELKDSHAWLNSPNADHKDITAAPGETSKEPANSKPSAGLVEI